VIQRVSSVGSTATANRSAAIRPEVQKFLDGLAESSIQGIKATTRGIGPMQRFQAQAPQTFPAGRFQVDYLASDDTVRSLVFQTEAGVGHLQPVTPGQTRIEGYIAILADPQDSQSEKIRLNPKEQDALLKATYARAGKYMTQPVATATQNVINYTAAIRFSGQGAQAVAKRHGELAG